jgi:hypothetical protein
MMFSFSGDMYKDDSTYAGSASGLNFLLYAMSMVVGLSQERIFRVLTRTGMGY